MESMNFWVPFVAALIPMVIGAIYYHPKVLGNAWMSSSGVTEEMVQSGNMLKIFGLSYIFSVLIAMSLLPMVIHQMGVYSIFADIPEATDPNTDVGAYLADFMSNYGDKFRTFKHGALHGFISSIFFALPLIGIVALFERKSLKYIFIHFGYWAISLALMGGMICQLA
jgi:hypothetical protein